MFVELMETGVRMTNEELTQAAFDAIACLTTVPTERLQITANHGVIRLEGSVENGHQRETAEEVTRRLLGVQNVINGLVIAPKRQGQAVQRQGLFEYSW